MSISRKTVKCGLATHGILYSTEKKYTIAIFNNMDNPWKHLFGKRGSPRELQKV